MSPTDSYSQHVVTAVIVAHDGAAWLPRLIEALGAQTTPVQRVVAVDTGSRDRSGSLLTAQLGQAAVFGMDRATGYGAAVRRAVQHRSATVAVSAPDRRGRADGVEWLWLLHDDCEPAADALEQLLRGAAETSRSAVIGPKLRDWADRDRIVEAGLAIDTAGRRVTGIEPREVDQGQHDGDRDVLAVSSAGMLVRRDVWERLGGFDPAMTLFDEDIDFCWRVHQAGFRVRLITDAVVYHARAATRGQRAISVGRRARLLDRRNGLLTLLGNLPFGAMLAALVGNLTLSLLRTLFYLVAKRPAMALDESAATLGVVGHPLRLVAARRRRANGRRAAYSRLRADVPPGRSIRRFAERAAMVLSRPTSDNLAGTHHATDDPSDDDSLLVDSGFMQRMLTRPGVLLVLALITVAAVAERRVLTGGTLGGGALLPAWEGASGLWSQFLQPYHTIGIGSASVGPPYVGALAVLATVLLGKAWLAVDVLLLGCVPLAGLTAYLSLGRVIRSVSVRVWAAASYALLPIAFGAISAGRLGSAVGFVLVPVIGGTAGRMVTEPPKRARRAAWATGLAVTVGAAFVPLLWPLVVVGAVLAGLVLRRGVAMLTNLIIVAVTPLVLLMPWLLPLLTHPTGLLLEAGIQQPGLAAADLPASSLILLSPGGPGLPPYWASAALVAVGLAALLGSRRVALVAAGWGGALLGFATALAASRMTVTPVGGQPVTPWPGVALAVAAAGLLLAAASAADGVLSGGGRSGAARAATSRLPATVVALLACTAPALAAGWWLVKGVSGPIGPAPGELVPPLVTNAAGAGRQLRTLVLTSSRGPVSYMLLRGSSPEFSYPDVTQVPAAEAALSRAVASLVARGGNGASNQGQQLAGFDIGFVLVRAPVDTTLASTLDSVPGLTQVSATPTFDLWRLSSTPSRVSVLEPNGTVAAVTSGPVAVSGASVPAAGGTLLLAEPAGGWTAAVNGNRLTPVPSPAGSWAQAFRLPPGGGTLTLRRAALWHELLMGLEILAFLVVAGLALPGVRTAAELEAAESQDDEPEEQATPEPAGSGAGAAQGRSRRGADSGARSRTRAAARRVAGATSRSPAAAPPPGRVGVDARAGRPARAVDRETAAGTGAAVGRGTEGRHAAGAGRPSRTSEPSAERTTGEFSARRTGGPPADWAGAGTHGASTEVFSADGPGGDRGSSGSPARRPPMLSRLASMARAGHDPGTDGAGRAVSAAGSSEPGSAGASAGRDWPAGQPSSRFLPEPPPSRPVPAYPDDVRGGQPPRRRDRPSLSPSGSYEPPTGPSGNVDGREGRRSRSGPHSGPDYAPPGYASPGGSYSDGRDYGIAPDYAGDRGYGRGSGYPDERRDVQDPSGQRRHGRPGEPDGAGQSDWRRQASGWPRGAHAQGWPDDRGQQGSSAWPDEDADRWQPEPPAGEVRRGRRGRRHPESGGRAGPDYEGDGDSR